jgi:hypothetical protein
MTIGFIDRPSRLRHLHPRPRLRRRRILRRLELQLGPVNAGSYPKRPSAIMRRKPNMARMPQNKLPQKMMA